MTAIDDLRLWARRRETPLALAAWRLADALRRPRLPVIRPLHRALYAAHRGAAGGLRWAAQAVWYAPLFQSRLERTAPRLRLTCGMPQILGPLDIVLGADCKVNGVATWTGRAAAARRPRLEVGRNVTLGWRSVISVGTRVAIGDNALLSSDVHIAGYPGHPLDAAARAAGAPCSDAQSGDVVIGRDVWIGAGCFIGAGVEIGRGTVVAAHSVVTRDLPPFALAAGAPARVVRRLSQPTLGALDARAPASAARAPVEPPEPALSAEDWF
jgi:acetyltransferase-like isoleucine patch superfamily enzyme